MPFGMNSLTVNAPANASLSFQPMDIPAPVQFDRVIHVMNYTQATNSTLTVTVSYSQALFTKNASSMSLAYSTSGSFSINGSGTASSANNSGLRIFSIPWTTTIAAGNYYAGVWMRTTTAGANATFNVGLLVNVNSNFSGLIGVASAASAQMMLGNGEYSVTFSTAMPNSFAFSEIRGSGSQYLRPLAFYYTSGTV
jgi:hypothetical protein